MFWEDDDCDNFSNMIWDSQIRELNRSINTLKSYGDWFNKICYIKEAKYYYDQANLYTTKLSNLIKHVHCNDDLKVIVNDIRQVIERVVGVCTTSNN